MLVSYTVRVQRVCVCACVCHTQDKDKDNGLPQITCFGPPGQEALVTHTTRSLPLILRVYEKYLETKFPFRQLKVVFVPAAAMRARDPPVLAGSNTILVRTLARMVESQCRVHMQPCIQPWYVRTAVQS